MRLQRYKHDSKVSYALGATLVFELIKCQPNLLIRVFIRSTADSTKGILSIIELCKENKIPIEQNDKAFNILSPKGNCFIIAEFKKIEQQLKKASHIVLVNPSDAGNLGTIMRTAVGFGFGNIAIIKPAVDFYDPKVIRASMGAIFHLSIQEFNSIEDYCRRFPHNKRYAFMLSSKESISEITIREPYSLIFGNEATGLPDDFNDFCTTVIINHSSNIDSLNLPMAAGIAMFEFTKKIWRN